MRKLNNGGNMGIPDFEIEDSEHFRLIYATGASGGLAPNDGRIILYVDRIKTKPVPGKPGQVAVEKIVRERQIEVHVSPATWKSIVKWMSKHLERIEKQFGKIPEKPMPKQSESSSSIYR